MQNYLKINIKILELNKQNSLKCPEKLITDKLKF